MKEHEIKEKYGISKRTGIIIFIQLILILAALFLTILGVIRSSGMQRIMVYSGQAIMCSGLVLFGFIYFKTRDRHIFRIILYAYAFLEALRTALLNTTGIDPFIAGLCRFILAILACNCILLAERLENYYAERISYGLIVLESALYLIYLFKFPGLMNGHLNRFLPLVGILIAVSILLFIKAKNEQLGRPEKINGAIHKWQSFAIAGLCLFISITALGAVSYKHDVDRAADTAQNTITGDGQKITTKSFTAEDMLLSWTDDAQAKIKLDEYLKAVTKEGSSDFIPVEDRIAVFDLDGTLICETDPGYFDHILYNYRVLEDPEYKDKATEDQLNTAARIEGYFETGEYPEGMNVEHGKAVASAFSGMSVDDFIEYVHNVSEQVSPGYLGMERKDAFYQPMLEIIECLEANNFTVYIVSGTDRLIVRGLLKDNELLSIPVNQIIGSDETIVTQNQGNEDGLDYKFQDGDKLTLGGDFIIKNLQMNKVTAIAQEIGKQPVLSFGNSSGDYSMSEYVITNNKYLSMSFMLCCDDLERENGNIEKADKMKKYCQEHNCVPISMKNDWKTIYGENVKRMGK